MSLKPRLHDEASSTSWLVEPASSCKHYAKLACNIMLMSRRGLITLDCYEARYLTVNAMRHSVRSRLMVLRVIVSCLCINGVIIYFIRRNPWKAASFNCVYQIRYSSVTSPVQQPFLNPLPTFMSQSPSTTLSNNNQCGTSN